MNTYVAEQLTESDPFMRAALTCAYSVEGRTSPRPPVGAVVVQENEIIGSGATTPPFGPHAEVLALTSAGTRTHGATLYVTLEPCCITIHTPPCTSAILAAGIRRVVIGALDPNPLVSGQGIKLLQEAGIEVIFRPTPEAQRLLQPFEYYITSKRPYITAKWAMTLDGKIASQTGDAGWISGEPARAYVHDLRDRVDAILVGSGTARRDNPRLTVRLTAEQRLIHRSDRPTPPLRVVMTSSGELPAHLNLLQPELASRTCILVGEDCPPASHQHLAATGVEVVQVSTNASGRIELSSALQALADKGLMHILLEGGSQLLGSAFQQQRINHVAVFIAPKLIGGQGAPSPIGGNGLSRMSQAYRLTQVKQQVFGEDLLLEGDVLYT